ncbi:ATP-dependent RNA helicase [Entamoeba marina]
MSRRKQRVGKQLEKQRLEKIQRLKENVSTPKETVVVNKKISTEEAIENKKQRKEKEQKAPKQPQPTKGDVLNKEHLRVIYDTLLNDYNLSYQCISDGMTSTYTQFGNELTIEIVLDWICLNVPQSDLPPILGGSLGNPKPEELKIEQKPQSIKSVANTNDVSQSTTLSSTDYILQRYQYEDSDEDIDASLERSAFREPKKKEKKPKKTIEEMKAEGQKRKQQKLEEQQKKENELQEEEDLFDLASFSLDGTMKEETNEPKWIVISASDDKKWTGKIPSLLTGEYCRKQKYETPKYKDVECKYGCYLMRATCQLNDKKHTLMKVSLPDDYICFEEKATAKNYIALRLLFELKVDRNFINNFSPRYQEVYDEWLTSSPAERKKNALITQLLQLPKPTKEKKNIIPQTLKHFTKEHIVYDKNTNEYYKKAMEKEISNSSYQNMLPARQELPIHEIKSKFLELLNTHQVIVVSGTTGSGKSTQLPQYVLENELLQNRGKATKIYVTQPRRISAVGLSSRVADERGSSNHVGHQIRFEKTGNEKLVYCTVGVMLRKVLGNPELSEVSHLFLDEVHERDLNTDFMLLLLKDLITKNKKIKIIVMSATLAVELFENYFEGAATLRVESRLHPVTTHYLDDVIALTNYAIDQASIYYNKHYDDLSKRKVGDEYVTVDMNKVHDAIKKTTSDMINQSVVNTELIVDLITVLTKTKPVGCVLIFLPGIHEITSLYNELVSTPPFNDSTTHKIHVLHSSVPLQQQKLAFNIYSKTTWKFILATNIAETSVTIPDAKYLIDTGLVRIMSYDKSSRLQRLFVSKISKANAMQRLGRVGRVSSGECYKMYSKSRESSFDTYPQPEIKRLPLDNLLLQILLLGQNDPLTFIQNALDAPSVSSIEKALRHLVTLKAAVSTLPPSLNNNGRITYSAAPLGAALAALPVDVTVGKMLLLGCACGVSSDVATLAATMSVQSPVQGETASTIKKRFCKEPSDHLALVNLVNGYIDALKEKKRKYILLETKKQFLELLKSFGYPIKELSGLPRKQILLFILTFVFYPNIISPQKVEGKSAVNYKYMTKKHQVYMNPSSINFTPKVEYADYWFIYTTMVKSNRISSYVALVSNNFNIHFKTKSVTVDGWLTTSCSAIAACKLNQLRKELKASLDDVIDQKTQFSVDFLKTLVECRL